MLNKAQIAAFAIETLNAANGANLHDEFDAGGDADAAFVYLCDNADEILEIAFFKGHGFKIEVIWFANSLDVAAFCVVVSHTGEDIAEGDSGGESVATYAFANEHDATVAACGLMAGLVGMTNATGA